MAKLLTAEKQAKIDVDSLLAKPWESVQRILAESGVPYKVVMTRSTKKFFPLTEEDDYVVRIQKTRAECEHLLVTLAAPPLPHESIRKTLG